LYPTHPKHHPLHPNLSSDKMNSRKRPFIFKSTPTKLKSRLVSINSLPHREGWGGPLTPLALWGGVGGEAYTLVAPVTPFRRGCQPFVQRRCGTRAPLIAKFRAHARNLPLYPFFTTIKGSQKPKSVSCKEHFSPKSVLHKEHCSDHIVTYKNKGCNPISRLAAFLSFIARPFSRASSPINPLRLPRDSGKWEQLPLLRIHLAP
jgi:hypothetical protein